MKCFFTKIGRFFWSWGFLKFILWVATFIVFFYAEEDWRGARAWAATKAEWEAKGESFDYNKFIPPPIPDDQNLAAIPLFKLEPVKSNNPDFSHTYERAFHLEQALRTREQTGNDLPSTGNWQRGELPDLAKIRNVIATNYLAVFKDTKPPENTLAQLEALYPFLIDLRAAAAERPLCRFPSDYATSPPAARALPLLIGQLKLSKILTLHAILALDHRQSDVALEDIKTSYTLLSGAQRDPTLVGGLVAMGMESVSDAALYDGLAQHLWSDAQLVEIDHTLKPIDFLDVYRFDMRSEAAESISNLDFYKNEPQGKIIKLITGMSSEPADADNTPLPGYPDFVGQILSLWPGGWWDQNKRQKASLVFNSLPVVDPKTHRVFPARINELEKQVHDLRMRAWAPWNIFAALTTSYLPTTPPKFTQGQVWVDEARIACALERYRLAHGIYPHSLEELAPAYIDTVPHDIINGEPYHYQLRPDGTFLLYSVGWNQKDDGGKVVYEKDSPSRLDYRNGDWVWPTPK